MQKKKWIIWFACILFLFVLSSLGIYKIMQNIKIDKEELQKQESSVQENYARFNKVATSFNNQKKKIDSFIQEVYFTTLPEQEEKMVKELNTFREIIEEMNEIGKTLQELCQVTYVNQQINNYCTSFEISYDTARTLYKDTVANYNGLICQYNEWRGDNSKYKELFSYEVEGS